jgi:hypothetical protein
VSKQNNGSDTDAHIPRHMAGSMGAPRHRVKPPEPIGRALLTVCLTTLASARLYQTVAKSEGVQAREAAH